MAMGVTGLARRVERADRAVGARPWKGAARGECSTMQRAAAFLLCLYRILVYAEQGGKVAADRYSIYWNSSNPRLQREEYVVEVQINDYLDIYCPGLTHRGRLESHIIYMVNFDGYQSCDPSGRGFKRWNCTRPYAMHAPLKYSEKFQLFTPFSLGFEFQPGQEYYYISSSFVGGFKRCLKLRVAVCCPINESRVVTAQASRSKARQGPSASPTGFLLILALLPLLLTQAYVPLFT
uniref:ephrin-A2-like isoform X2 n=1 Tax=Myxine glutinosa TaxID=7769 RepID=UPI00358E02C5